MPEANLPLDAPGTDSVSHQVCRENIKGDHVALTRLGGTAKLTSLEAWKMRSVPSERSFGLKHNDSEQCSEVGKSQD